MTNCTDYFIKDSDNVISLTLTEDGTGISGTWTDLDIDFLNINTGAVVLNISRGTDGSGVALHTATGVLTITPGFLTEDVSVLTSGQLYPIRITVKSATETHGVVFGAGDTDTKIWFLVQDNTA